MDVSLDDLLDLRLKCMAKIDDLQKQIADLKEECSGLEKQTSEITAEVQKHSTAITFAGFSGLPSPKDKDSFWAGPKSPKELVSVAEGLLNVDVALITDGVELQLMAQKMQQMIHEMSQASTRFVGKEGQTQEAKVAKDRAEEDEVTRLHNELRQLEEEYHFLARSLTPSAP